MSRFIVFFDFEKVCFALVGSVYCGGGGVVFGCCVCVVVCIYFDVEEGVFWFRHCVCMNVVWCGGEWY